MFGLLLCILIVFFSSETFSFRDLLHPDQNQVMNNRMQGRRDYFDKSVIDKFDLISDFYQLSAQAACQCGILNDHGRLQNQGRNQKERRKEGPLSIIE